MWSARVGVVVTGWFGFWGNLFGRVEWKGLDFTQLGHKKNKIRDEVIKTSTFASSQIKPMRQKRRRDSSEEPGGRVDRSYNNKSVRVQVYGSGDPGPSLEVWNGGGRAPRVLSTNCVCQPWYQGTSRFPTSGISWPTRFCYFTLNLIYLAVHWSKLHQYSS